VSKLSTKKKQLHSILAGELRRDLIAKLRPGDQLPSEEALEKQYDVSNVTVRHALQSLTESGWIERRHGCGNFVADPLAKRELGVLMELDATQPRLSRFHLRVTYLLRDYLHDHGARARLYLGSQTVFNVAEATGVPTCREFVRDVEAGRLAGVAYVYAPWNMSAQVLSDAAGIPSVALWGEGYPHRVELDYCGLVRAGAEYLREHGRRRIAVAGWGVENFPGVQRAGLRDLLREAEVTVPEEWLRLEFHPDDPGAGWEDFRELWTARAEKPDGLLVLDDILFADMRAALVESGARIPADLLVVTHANKGLEVAAPFPVTRLEFDPAEAAAALGEMLLAAARREVLEPPVRVVPAQLREAAPVEGQGIPRTQEV